MAARFARPIARRSALYGAVLALAGAGSGAVAAEPAGEIVLMGYSGSFQDNYTKVVVEPFMLEHPGIRVIYDAQGSSAQMLGRLRAQKAAPQADVDIMDFSVSRVANKEGLFSKLDPAAVPNLADVYDEARMGEGMGPGITFDSLVMLYNADAVKPPPAGIPDLLDPAHKGRIVFSPAPNVVGIALQLVVAAYLGGDYKGSTDPEIDLLKKIAANVQTWEAMPDNYTMIINGGADIGVGWNARAQDYSDRSGGKLRSVAMRSGSILDMDTINLVAGAKNPAAAQVFIDYALSAAPQERLARIMYYGPTNRKASLPPEIMARTSSYPPTLGKMIPVDWNYVASVQDQWTNRWRREVIPAR